MIGDTGCRMGVVGRAAGNSRRATIRARWPFAAIAQQVAAWQPDLIIHVGDYLYREDACPAGNSGCAGSPYSDNLGDVAGRFLQPRPGRCSPRRRSSFVRGNHETCARAGGRGGRAYLDPAPDAGDLPGVHRSLRVVLLGDVQLLVVDSAAAADEHSTSEETAAYEAQFAEVARLAGDNAWLVTHKPVSGGDRGQARAAESRSRTPVLRRRPTTGCPPGCSYDRRAHHLAELLIFDPAAARPPQLIVGNGGTTLDRNYTESLTGLALDDAALATGQTIEQFGFLTLERTDAGWVATERDLNRRRRHDLHDRRADGELHVCRRVAHRGLSRASERPPTPSSGVVPPLVEQGRTRPKVRASLRLR